MMKEIERKFLVNSLPLNLESYKQYEIDQGYICVDGDGTEVRLRLKNQNYTITVKTGKGLVRDEYEISIPFEQYDKLWPTTSGRRIKKTRYYIPHQNVTILLDIYHGHLKGLHIVEVEFPSIDESSKFSPPDWFGAEVTDDVRYKNKNLAIYGITSN